MPSQDHGNRRRISRQLILVCILLNVSLLPSASRTPCNSSLARGKLEAVKHKHTDYVLKTVNHSLLYLFQLYDPRVGPKVETVDGANVYFFRDTDKLVCICMSICSTF